VSDGLEGLVHAKAAELTPTQVMPPETGAAANGLVEVRGGIAAGDRVVVNPPASLQNGDRVERHQ